MRVLFILLIQHELINLNGTIGTKTINVLELWTRIRDLQLLILWKFGWNPSYKLYMYNWFWFAPFTSGDVERFLFTWRNINGSYSCIK